MSESNTSPTTLLSLRQLVARHPGLSVGGVRWALFYRHTNGLEASGAIVNFGRRILFDELAFVAWLRTSGATLTDATARRREVA